MMSAILLRWLACACVCARVARSGVTLRRAGWLERVAAEHRARLVADVRGLPFSARVEPAPPGFRDAAGWGYPAAAHLLALLGASDAAAPARAALRRSLGLSPATRRFFANKEQSWKLFPSLGKDHPNEIYYDFSSRETTAPSDSSTSSEVSEDEVLVLENPVEAHLPSARLSIAALKELLEGRAHYGRVMPDTTRSTIEWISKNASTTAPAAENQTATAADDTATPAEAAATAPKDTAKGDAEGATEGAAEGATEAAAEGATEGAAEAEPPADRPKRQNSDHMENSQIRRKQRRA